MSLNARITGSTEVGSLPGCRSTHDAVIASSATAQLSVRSPKSMTPSARTPPRPRDTTTFASVRSRCTACRGRSSASGSMRDHACRAAVSMHGPVCRVLDMRNQFGDNVGAVAQIPLQDPVEAGVCEVGERPADPARDLAETGRRRWGTGSPTRTAFRRAGNAAAGRRRCRPPDPLWSCTSHRRRSAAAPRCATRVRRRRSASAARSWASNSVPLNAGFAIFNTPTISPSASASR